MSLSCTNFSTFGVASCRVGANDGGMGFLRRGKGLEIFFFLVIFEEIGVFVSGVIDPDGASVGGDGEAVEAKFVKYGFEGHLVFFDEEVGQAVKLFTGQGGKVEVVAGDEFGFAGGDDGEGVIGGDGGTVGAEDFGPASGADGVICRDGELPVDRGVHGGPLKDEG